MHGKLVDVELPKSHFHTVQEVQVEVQVQVHVQVANAFESHPVEEPRSARPPLGAAFV